MSFPERPVHPEFQVDVNPVTDPLLPTFRDKVTDTLRRVGDRLFMANPHGAGVTKDYYKDLDAEMDPLLQSHNLDKNNSTVQAYLNSMKQARRSNIEGLGRYRTALFTNLEQRSVDAAVRDGLLAVWDAHLVAYADARLDETFRDNSKDGHDLEKLVNVFKDGLGVAFSEQTELIHRYDLLGLIKNMYKANTSEHRYKTDTLKTADGLVHIDDRGNFSQAEALLLRECKGALKGQRLVDILARTETEYDPKRYKSHEDYKQFGWLEIATNKDGTIVNTEMSQLQQAAIWFAEATHVLPKITSEEAELWIAGKLSQDSSDPKVADAARRCMYIQKYWGPKNAVTFHGLYPLLALASYNDAGTVLALPEFANQLKGNTSEQTYKVMVPTPDKTGFVEKVYKFLRTDRGSFTEMFAPFSYLSKLTDEEIYYRDSSDFPQGLAKIADMTSYHYMTSKINSMRDFIAAIIAKVSEKRWQSIGTKELSEIFQVMGKAGREMIKNSKDREEFMFKWMDWAAQREMQSMKRVEEVTEKVGLDLQELMRHGFDLGRFRWIEQSPINIEELDPAKYSQEERWRDVIFRLGAADKGVWDSLKDDVLPNVVENKKKFTKEQKKRSLLRSIPGVGTAHDGRFMVLKMYLGIQDNRDQARGYNLSGFDVFRRNITREDGSTDAPVTFDELLRYSGMEIDRSGEVRPVGDLGKLAGDADPLRARKTRWQNYTSAVTEYRAYINDKKNGRVGYISQAAYAELQLDPAVFEALDFASNAGTDRQDPRHGDSLRSQILPIVRDRSDLYRPVVNGAHTVVKYYHPDFYYGARTLHQFQEIANQRPVLSPTGIPVGNNGAIGKINERSSDDYGWGDVRDKYQMAQTYLAITMAPLAVRPRESDLDAIGKRVRKGDNGVMYTMIKAADRDVFDKELVEAGIRDGGWLIYKMERPDGRIEYRNHDRKDMVRVDNIRYGSGDYKYLTKYPTEVCINPMMFEYPIELIYLSLGRQRAHCLDLARQELVNLGHDPNDAKNEKWMQEKASALFDEMLRASGVLTPSDMYGIWRKLLDDEMIDDVQFTEVVDLCGCDAGLGYRGDSPQAINRQVANFEASCANLKIAQKDSAEREKQTDRQSAEGFYKFAENVHAYLTKPFPLVGEVVLDPIKGQGGRDLLNRGTAGFVGILGGVAAGAAATTVLMGAFNPMLSLAVGVGGFLAGYRYGWDAGDGRPSLYSGITGPMADVFRFFGIKNPELGYRRQAQTLDALAGGTGRWNCTVDSSKIGQLVFERFNLYRKLYNEAHGIASPGAKA